MKKIEIDKNNGANCMRALYRQYQILLYNDPKSLVVSEYYRLKSLHNSERYRREVFKFHLENFFILVNYLSRSHENLFNLEWLSYQPSDFVFYYLYFHGNPELLSLQNADIFAGYYDCIHMKGPVVWSLYEFLPIFELSRDFSKVSFLDFEV